MKHILAFMIFPLIFLSTACSDNNAAKNDNALENTGHSAIKTPSVVKEVAYKKGDVVPHDEVCMVNNMFMGKKQIEVNYNAKLYYGCCEMCEKRIPQEPGVRMAVDPVSKKQVDKAEAVIVITGDAGEVSYFENYENYNAFFKP